MKPAEEWCEDMFSQGNWVTADTYTIKAIQLDAFKAGADWAANNIPKFYCESHDRRYAARETRDRIVSEISNLKEILK